MKRRTVSFLDIVLTHYRVAFHTRVREILAGHEIDYRLIYGQPSPRESLRKDTVSLPWAMEIRNIYLPIGHAEAVWQPALSEIFSSDLSIVGQENKFLLNYLVQALPRWWRPKIALFGHGRNFQSRIAGGGRERWKRLWSTRCDWWFAYTDDTRGIIEGIGFPAERITVFNNAIDTTDIQAEAAAVTPQRLQTLKQTLGLTGDNVCVFVGGLYPDKRLSFLVEALDRVQSQLPDFECVIVGGGVDLPLVQGLAAARPWLKVTGPRFGREKVELLLLGKLFLMPGLVGLAALDAFAVGLPVVTTDYPYHSPEIAYVRSGFNGLICAPHDDVNVYAVAIVSLLMNPTERARLCSGAVETSKLLTIEEMAQRFCAGVVAALDAAKL